MNDEEETKLMNDIILHIAEGIPQGTPPMVAISALLATTAGIGISAGFDLQTLIAVLKIAMSQARKVKAAS